MKKIVFVMLILILLTGCSDEKSTEFQSKIIENNSSYNYEKYTKIKNMTADVELTLLDKHLDINSISFENETYNNGKYKTAVFTIDNDVDVTLKYDKKQNLMLIRVYCSNEDNETLNDTKYAILNWDYLGFSVDEISEAYSNESVEIGNYSIENSENDLIISDSRYKNN